jgi:hypothetical protein
MAFDKAGFNSGQNSKKGNAPAIHTYKTADVMSTVNTAGYFDNGTTTNTGMRDILSEGDLIWVYSTGEPTGSKFALMAVNSVSSGIIDVAEQTAVGATDSD